MSVIRFGRYVRAGLGVRRAAFLAFNASLDYLVRQMIAVAVIVILATALYYK